MKIAALCLLAVLWGGCTTFKRYAQAPDEAHLANVKADVALLLLSRPTLAEFELAACQLGGTLARLAPGSTEVYFPLRPRGGERHLLVVKYRTDESNRVVVLSTKEAVLPDH